MIKKDYKNVLASFILISKPLPVGKEPLPKGGLEKQPENKESERGSNEV
jgi:hypothetical protein